MEKRRTSVYILCHVPWATVCWVAYYDENTKSKKMLQNCASNTICMYLQRKGKRWKPVSMASHWLWDHSVWKIDYFRNMTRKIWRMIYPAKDVIGALRSILILTGMFFLHFLKECLIAISFKISLSWYIASNIHSIYEFCYLFDNY